MFWYTMGVPPLESEILIMKGQTSPHRSIVIAAGQYLLTHRWLIFVLGMGLVILVEGIEHWPLSLTVNAHFAQEVIIYGLFGPLAVWILLTLLARALTAEIPIKKIQAEATQAERQRIARELHDKLAQNLGYLHFKLDQLSQSSSTVTLEDIALIQVDLDQMRQIANQAYEEVRNTLNALRSDGQPVLSLRAAIKQQAADVEQRAGLPVLVDYQDNGQAICQIVGQTLLDISSEALNNAAKHARATQVEVRLCCTPAQVSLVVVDNGRGFAAEQQEPPGHYGLAIMRERASMLGGALTIQSTPGQGTQIRGQFPRTAAGDGLLQICSHTQCKVLNQCRYEHSTR